MIEQHERIDRLEERVTDVERTVTTMDATLAAVRMDTKQILEAVSTARKVTSLAWRYGKPFTISLASAAAAGGYLSPSFAAAVRSFLGLQA